MSITNPNILIDGISVEYTNGAFPAKVTGLFVEGHMAGMPGTYAWDNEFTQFEKTVNNQQELRDAMMLMVDRLFPAPASPAQEA